MMITIHGLPTNIKYQDLKAVIKQECNITDFILDNLLPEGKDFKKVRVGLANDSEGNYVMKCLNGYRFSGHILQVTPVGKSGEFQSQQNAFSDQGRVDPWNNQSLWSGTQQHQSQYAYHNQPINTDGPSNVMNQSARSQYDQRTVKSTIIDRVGPPSQGLSISLKNAPTQTGTQVREGLLRTVQVIDTSRNAPQRQNSYASHNRPAAINKDNYQGRQYNATQQNLGHYQEQTWAQQEQQSKHQRMVYENPSQDKRGPVKDTSNDVSFKEKHQFQARAQEIPQERTDSNRRNVQPIDVHMSRRFPSPNYRPLSPDISPGRSYAAESPSYRLDSPNTQRISPFGIAPSRSMGIGRPGSPSRRRPSPGIKVLPTGRGQGHIASRKDDERVVPRHHDVIHTTPSKVTGKERFSPTRNFVDTRVAKPIRPAYDSRSDSNQASYSGGFRPNENIHYPSKGREERPDPWSNRVSEHNTSHCEERRDMRRMPKFEVPRSIEHSRLIENEVKRSSSRNRESRSPRRDRSPIRDRFKRHSPSPRSPRRSWALEKRRSPEDTDVPPPPTWPCQDHNAIKDIRGKRKPYPVQVENNRGPTWDMNKYDPTPDDRREIRPNADDRRPFERGSIAVRKDLEKWKPIGTDSPKLSPPRYKPEENERALRRREIDTRHQDHRMPDAEQKRPERALEHRRGDARPYKSDFTDASELSKIKEELTRRIEKKTEILKKQEELQKEIEDVYKRAADFTKKVEYRKGDRRHDDYKEQGRRDNPDPKEFDLPTLTFLKEERRERYYEDGRPEEKGKISRHEESRADDEKRTKACEAITDKILEKFGGMLPRDVTFRVKKEMNFAVKKILKRIFGDQDVSFIEMIIKFKAKHSTKDEEDIYDSILSGFPNQYRNLKRPAKGEAFLPAEVAAKISKPSPVSNVETEHESRYKERPAQRNVSSKKLVSKRSDMKVHSVENRKIIAKKFIKEKENDAINETVKTESQEEIEAMFPSPAPQDSKELNQLTTKLLEYELRHIMIKVWQVFPDDPDTDDVKIVTEKFRNEAGDDLRNMIGLNVTKRLLNVHNKLIVKVRFSCRPEKENLLAFLRKYRISGFKRITTATNTFAAQLKSIDDFDKICSTKEIRCGKAKITITPCYNFGKRPPHLKTKFVEDTDDEKTNESQVTPETKTDVKAKLEVNEATKDKLNTVTAQEKHTKGDNVQVDKSPKELITKSTPEQKSSPNTAEKVVNAATKLTKPTAADTKQDTQTQNIIKKKSQSAANIPTKTVEHSNNQLNTKKLKSVTSVQPKTVTVKKTTVKPSEQPSGLVSADKIQKPNKNDIINKYNDYDEMDDEDIVALLADAVVLSECGSDNE